MAVSPTLLAGCSVRAGQRDAVTSRGVVACAVRAAATNVSCRVSSAPATTPLDVTASRWPARTEHPARSVGDTAIYQVCLLYTSDAADEEDSVDLGGRRI